MKLGERLVKLTCLGSVDVNVETLVERLVQVTTDIVGAGFVELLGVGKQVDGSFEDLDANCQFDSGSGEAGFDAGPVVVDLAQPLLDLVLWEGAIGGEVEEPFLFGIEFLEAGCKRGVDGADAVMFVGECFIELLSNLVGERRGQLQVPVVVKNRLFDQGSRQMGKVADVLLSTAAQEVCVVRAVASAGFGVDEP
ncbi:hypothetical protein ACWEKT_11700 [Nocardia takedensis]